MIRMKEGLKGSFTIEAAYVMAMVLLTVGIVIGQAGRIHDETKGAMILHEMTEKYRHEKELSAENGSGDLKDRADFWISFPSYSLQLTEKGRWIQGKAESGQWQKSIHGRAFRPETFLRKITLIESLGEMDENELYS